MADYIVASFIGDRFGSLRVVIKCSQFPMVTASLIQRFGAPTRTENPEFKTRGGAAGRAVRKIAAKVLWQMQLAQESTG